ncbi:MAG: LPS-assembly protein LptD, partial [Gammaproteobacteria bacterium]|nr:LPS-assembly protein LptD [Gammaproteobacteria bacterium]
MKPSVRITRHRRRLLSPLLLCALAGAAPAADDQCRIPVTTDPRLDALLKAAPNAPHIGNKGDRGEMSRSGDAELTGNVEIRMGQRLLTAEEAVVDAKQRRITVMGRSEYLDPTIHVVGKGGSFESGSGGTFEGARFELVDGSGRGSAKDAVVHDQTMLDLTRVRYTVCPPGNEDWVLKADTISLDQESRTGTGRNVQLNFKGVPILYTPWISFPVGSERKSGLLFPAFGSGGKTGTQVVVPWYWNMAPNYDSTFTARWFSSRGFRIDPEFRYLTERSKGTFDMQYLPHDTQRGDSRGLYAFKDVTNFEPRTRALVNASYVTDNSYFEDFGVGFEGTSIIFLNQLAEFRRNVEHWSLVGRTQNYQVIDNALADDARPYALLPQVVAAGRWNDLPRGFGATFDLEATNFYRDIGPQGVRVDTMPGLSWRTGRRSAYVEADAAWRYTAYGLHDTAPGTDNSLSRSLPILSLDSGLVLERTVGEKQRVQTLEPRALYLYVPYRNQDDIPIFDTATPDLNLVQLFRTNRYVGADRVGDANQVAVGLTSRLLDPAGGQQYLTATIGEAYYFEQPKVTLPGETPSNRSSSDIVAEVELDAFKYWSARVGYQWDPNASQTERGEFGLQYRPASDSVINASYRYQRDLLEQVDVSAAWPFADRWHGYARWVYSISESKTLDQFIGFEYASCCWALRVITRHFISSRSGASDTSLGIQLELKGLSSVGVDNEAFLRDAIRGYSAL